MIKTILIALFMLLVAVAPASATTAQTADGSDASSYQMAIDHSYMPTPDGSVTIYTTGCPSNGVSCALQRKIWLPPHDPANEPYTGAFMHELGHVLDWDVTLKACGCTDDTGMTPTRQQFEQIMGWDEPWSTGSDRPNEAWADVYESCADKSTSSKSDVVTTEYNFQLTADQFNAACRLITDTALQFRLDPAGAPSPGPIDNPPPWESQPAPAPVAPYVAPKPHTKARVIKHRHKRHRRIHHKSARSHR